jgi:hypothetical protein
VLLFGRVSPPSRLSCQGSNHVLFLSLAANPPNLWDLVSSQRIAPCLAEQACRVCNSTVPRSEVPLDLACSLSRKMPILNKYQ